MTRRKRYSAEFKREALRRADEVGVTDVLVAEELGIDARHPSQFTAALPPTPVVKSGKADIGNSTSALGCKPVVIEEAR